MSNTYSINSETNKYNEHYNLFCKNINPSLKKELGIKCDDDYQNYLKNDWEPPETYGLNNSERIIPQHYFNSNYKYFKDVDMFYELTKDIRNLQPLNKIQLNYVKKLPKEKIIELIEIYNSCLKNMNELIVLL